MTDSAQTLRADFSLSLEISSQALIIDDGTLDSGASTPPASASFINLFSEGIGDTTRYSADRVNLSANFSPLAPDPHALLKLRKTKIST